jgi:diadenosine tetraphosphate (Ap4A) HIT family hydrolase
MDCPFCTFEGIDPARRLGSNEMAVAFLDAFPVNPGHALVITRRHVTSWFDATPEERDAILTLVDVVRSELGARFHPAGYNLGINVGTAAGQTVPHLHVHVIPRYTGDVDDPTGGVRFVIPKRGNYRRPGFIPTAGDRDP